MSGAIASMGSGRNTPNHAFFLSALPCIRAIGSLNTRGCGIQPRNDYLIRCRTFLRSNARLCVCVWREGSTAGAHTHAHLSAHKHGYGGASCSQLVRTLSVTWWSLIG